MFGFSLPKLIFTVLVVVVVFYGFKAVSQLQERRERQVASRGKSGGGGKAAKRSAGVEDMVACDVCGTFVPARSARSCGRGDCPYAA
jgi:membrane protein implicated in regulation of membrane protease activity